MDLLVYIESIVVSMVVPRVLLGRLVNSRFRLLNLEFCLYTCLHADGKKPSIYIIEVTHFSSLALPFL